MKPEIISLNLDHAVKVLDFAFQPIVNLKTGNVYGYEALLRNYQKLGFENIFQLFDYAYQHDILHELDIKLRKKAIDRYGEAFKKGLLLFYNLDTRILENKNYRKGATREYLEKMGVDPSQVVFEVSERFKINNNIINIIQNYRSQGFRIAIDDFGVGNVCFESLYHIKPDILKIDGFFIDNLNNDLQKKTVLDFLVKMANSLGFSVIAEKVETRHQIYELDDIGINLAQGYFIAKPEMMVPFSSNIPIDIELKRGDKNYREDLLSICINTNPLSLKDKAIRLFDFIRYNDDIQYAPVVNIARQPIYVINLKKVLKSMVTSRFLLDLYMREDRKIQDLKEFFEKPAILEINDRINLEKLTSITLHNKNIVVLTENHRYVGMLTYSDLLSFVHKKKIYEAINSNPLTGLPGNLKIREFIDESLEKDSPFVMVYFDFDNFKPFNDKYGFRVGDRAIQLFSNILSAKLQNKGYFTGHIGGDDFFAGRIIENLEEAMADVENVVRQFNRQVVSFYDEKDRDAGFILGKDRDGNIKKFPLLSVSAAVLYIEKNKRSNVVFIDNVMAEIKKSAKNSGNGMSVAVLI